MAQPASGRPKSAPFRGGVLPEQVTLGGPRTVPTLPDSLVQPARTLLSLLTTLSAFGATLAFSTMYSSLASAPTYLAWAFAAYAVGVAETLVCQVVLVADFQGFSGRIYRSPAGIVAGIAIGFASVITGTLLVSLSMTKNMIYGIRAAGYTASALVALLVCASLCRLACAVRRRSQLLGSDAQRVSGIPQARAWASIFVSTPFGSVETIATPENSRVPEGQIPVSPERISSTGDWTDDPPLEPREQWVEEPGGPLAGAIVHASAAQSVQPFHPSRVSECTDPVGGDAASDNMPQEGIDEAGVPGTPVSTHAVITGPVCFQQGE